MNASPGTLVIAATPIGELIGIRWLFVNGVAVIADGKKTDALPGKPLRQVLTK